MDPPDLSSTQTKPNTNHHVITGVATRKQPHVIYDLLNKENKSSSFLVRFETANPRPRFVVEHRVVRAQYADLTKSDRFQLLHTCQFFVNFHELFDASITIPIGMYSCSGQEKDTFYAYIEVPYVDFYLKVYRIFKYDIPSWTATAWLNTNWPQREYADETVDHCYIRAVKKAEPTVTIQTKLLAKRYTRPSFDNKPAHRFKMPKVDASSWEIIEHCAEPIIGVARHRDPNEPWTIVDRFEAMEVMMKIVKKHHNVYRRGCYICVSLAEPYRFGSGIFENVPGFIAFPQGVPASFQMKSVQISCHNHLHNGSGTRLGVVDNGKTNKDQTDNASVRSDSDHSDDGRKSLFAHCFTFLRHPENNKNS